MDDSWQDSVVLITSRADGNGVYGTGFVVHQDKQGAYVLTCTHIVDDVGGEEWVKVNDIPAKVIASGLADGIDIAVLLVAGLADKPLLRPYVNSKIGVEFELAGYYHLDDNPKKKLVRRRLRGIFSDSIQAGMTWNTLVPVWEIEITSNDELRPGNSGSPVIDENNHVIGIVNTRLNANKKRGWVTPIEELRKIWPELFFPKSGTPRSWLYGQSKHFREYLSAKIILAIPALVLIVLSFPDLLKPVPLFEWMSSYPVTTPIIGGALVLLFLPLLIISFAPEPQNSRKGPITKNNRKWIIATALATTGFLLSSLLLAVALIRPPGCPTVFCAEIVPQVVTNPHGVRDANLEAFLITKPQSPFFMIPGNPAQYAQTDLPQSIGAVRLDGKPSVSFYRIVIGIHSLQQGLYGVTITHVGLEILQTPATPRPLNVWNQGLPQDYHTNPYLAVYNGELPGSVIPATYTPSPLANVSLLPGEPDQLDIQVNSHVLAYIQFRVQITYRVTNLSQTHLLTLPNSFEVIFSNVLNWNTYQIQDGHFVRSS